MKFTDLLKLDEPVLLGNLLVFVQYLLSDSSDFTNSSKYFPVQVSFENDDDILYKKGTDADRLKYFAISDEDITDI